MTIDFFHGLPICCYYFLKELVIVIRKITLKIFPMTIDFFLICLLHIQNAPDCRFCQT